MSKMYIVYWSMTGNTEAMAQAIAEGGKTAGAEVKLWQVSDVDTAELLAGDLLAFGCPAMGDEVLEESEFDPFFSGIEKDLSGKKVALFGSYGWGDGQWMRDWEDRVKKAGADLFKGEGLMANEAPDDDAVEACRAFGAAFAAY